MNTFGKIRKKGIVLGFTALQTAYALLGLNGCSSMANEAISSIGKHFQSLERHIDESRMKYEYALNRVLDDKSEFAEAMANPLFDENHTEPSDFDPYIIPGSKKSSLKDFKIEYESLCETLYNLSQEKMVLFYNLLGDSNPEAVEKLTILLQDYSYSKDLRKQIIKKNSPKVAQQILGQFYKKEPKL
jgi:hypothetical protein